MPDWQENPTVELRRDQVRPGYIIHSSHGYRLLVEHVDDRAKETHGDDRHVGFQGRLHAKLEGLIRSERYPAGSKIPVEVASIEAVESEERRSALVQLADDDLRIIFGGLIARREALYTAQATRPVEPRLAEIERVCALADAVEKARLEVGLGRA